MGEVREVLYQGRPYLMEKVPIDALPEWEAERGLRAVGRVRMYNMSWPPMILYEPMGSDGGEDVPEAKQTSFL